MSSIKLSSSGGGSVSLSAAPTSTDVTIQFPSGNSTVGQALVASSTSGELDWESVKTDSSIQVFRGFNFEPNDPYHLTNLNSDAISPQTVNYTGFRDGSGNPSGNIDTHSAYDSTNLCWIAPEFAYYSVTHVLAVKGNSSNTTTRHIGNFIEHTNSTNTIYERYSTYSQLAPSITDYCFITNTVNVLMLPTDRIYFKAGRVSNSSHATHDSICAPDPFNTGAPVSLADTPGSYVSIHKIRGF